MELVSFYVNVDSTALMFLKNITVSSIQFSSLYLIKTINCFQIDIYISNVVYLGMGNGLIELDIRNFFMENSLIFVESQYQKCSLIKSSLNSTINKFEIKYSIFMGYYKEPAYTYGAVLYIISN